MKTFNITSTITVEAKSAKEVDAMIEKEKKNTSMSDLAYDLLNNAQVDEE